MANMDRDSDTPAGTPAGSSGIFGRGLDVLFGEAEESPPAGAQGHEPAGTTDLPSPPPPPDVEGTTVGETQSLTTPRKTLAIRGTPAKVGEIVGSAAPDSALQATATTPTAVPPPATEYEPSSRRPAPPGVTRLTGGVPPKDGDGGTRRQVSLRVGGVMMDLPAEDLASLVPPGPGERVVDEIEITPRDYSREDQDRIMNELSMERRDDLMQQLDSLYEVTSTQLAAHQQHSGTALKLLHQARSILVERPYAFADAELRMHAARTLINRTEDSRRISNRNWPWLLLYQLGWALLLLAGVVMEGPLEAWIGRLSMSGTASMLGIFPAWGTMMVGGIGGVVCAIWSLWYHVSDQQDYDAQYNLWYLVQPFQGMVLGLIIYLVIAAGFLAFQTDISSPNAATAAKYFPWLVAAIAGIRQTFVYELLERIVRIISPRTD